MDIKPAPQALVPGYFATRFSGSTLRFDKIAKARNLHMPQFFREPTQSRLRCSARDAEDGTAMGFAPKPAPARIPVAGPALLSTFQTGSAA